MRENGSAPIPAPARHWRANHDSTAFAVGRCRTSSATVLFLASSASFPAQHPARILGTVNGYSKAASARPQTGHSDRGADAFRNADVFPGSPVPCRRRTVATTPLGAWNVRIIRQVFQVGISFCVNHGRSTNPPINQEKICDNIGSCTECNSRSCIFLDAAAKTKRAAKDRGSPECTRVRAAIGRLTRRRGGRCRRRSCSRRRADSDSPASRLAP